MKWIKNSCNNCGECCIEYPTIRFISPDEWSQILKFIKKEYDSILFVKFFNHLIQRYLIIPYKPAIEDFSFGSGLFGVLDEAINPCPFLRFDFEDVKYYCEIQEIKPEVCEGFFCNPHGPTSRLNREVILHFGRVLDYPQCHSCKEYNYAHHRPRYEGETTECERGEGCRFLVRRINFFLTYAKHHQGQKDTLLFTKKLLNILYKQDKLFKNQLSPDLGLTESQIDFNKDNYSKDRKSVV